MSKTLMREAWQSRETFATVLLTLFLDRFGPEALDWDPSTITLEVEEEFKCDLPQLSLDRLIVAGQILTTDRFFKSLPDFINFCNVLGGDEYNPEMWDPADAEEVAWGVTEAMLLYPPDEDDPEPFTDEIRAYIGAVLDREGLINPPDILRIALRMSKVRPSIEEFSDDPEMFSAIYKVEDGKRVDIEQSIRLKTRLLAAQLSALRLENGKVETVIQTLENAANT